MVYIAGVQSDAAKPATEKLPAAITPSGSSASDLVDSGVVNCSVF